MKKNLMLALDVTSLLTKLFLASICYKVHPGLTMMLVLSYVSYGVISFYFMHLQAQEDRQFLEKITDLIERESKQTDEEK